jgi:hypothetical protein
MRTQLNKIRVSKILASFVIVILILTVAPIPPAYAAMRTSTANGAWTDPATWDCTCLPAATDDVVINSNVSTGAVTVNNLTINAGYTLTTSGNVTMNGTTFLLNGTFAAGTSLTHNIGGNWVNNGTFSYTTASVINFNGNNALQTISGTSTTAFGNIIVNKGTVNTNVLDVQSLITISSGGLTLTNGTFKLSSASTITPFNATTTIPSTAGIWVNGGTLNGGNFTTTNNGLIRVSGGTAIFGTSSGNALTNSSTGTTIIEGGTTIVSGRFHNSGGSVTISNGTLRVTTVGLNNGSNAGFEMSLSSNLTMTGGTVELQQANTGSGGDLKILNSTGSKSITGGTFQIGNSSTSASQIFKINSAVPIFNLTINNTNNPTGRLDTNDLTVNGTITIVGGTLDAATNNKNITIRGNWSNSGTFTPGTGAVTFNGGAAQTIGGTSATTFNNLTVNNTNGVSLSGVDATVNGTLTFTNGNFTTNANTLTIGSSGSVTGAGTGKYIYGNLRKTVSTGSPTLTYEVGDASVYAPISITFNNVTVSGTLTGSTTAGRHPQFLSANIGDKYVNRYWTLTPSGLTFTSYDATFTFVSGDLVGSPDTSTLIVQKYNGTWSDPVTHSSTSTTVTGNGFTSFSDFFAGNGGTPTPVTLSYFKASAQGGTVIFDWSTATEIGNVGFNLYVENDGQKTRINQELIPSNAVDSLERQDYSFSADVPGDTFYIESVDVFGATERHGPFQLGQEYGSRIAPDPINWPAIRAEHAIQPASPPLTLDQVQTIPDETAQDDSSVTAEPTATPEILPTLPPHKGRHNALTAPSIIVNIQVRQTGLYRVTYEMLRDAGYDLSGMLASQVKLTNRGQAVPIYVKSAAKFGPGSYFEFYGQALDTVYTDTNIYRLELGSPAPRIASSSAVPGKGSTPPVSFTDTLTVNNQRAYASFYALEDGWYDTSMLVYTTSKSWSFSFDVTNLADANAPATLKLTVWGVTDWPQAPDHHLIVSVNGVQVASQIFDGLTVQTIEINLPPGTLLSGANTLQLTLPGDTGVQYDMVNFDKFSLTYQRTFQAQDGRLTFTASDKMFKITDLPSKNVTVYRLDKNGPVRLNNLQVQASGSAFNATFVGTGQSATYLVSAVELLYVPVLQAPRPTANLNQPAQYLVIAYPDFIPGLQPLLQARQAQGLTVNMVDVNDVYAQYSYGIFDPHAIQQYIAYAYKNLGTQYVLLVGGDTYDYRNYLGRNSVSFIPSLYADTGTARLVPVDPLFADVNKDNVPDLAIGRFPVRTNAELALMVNKTLAYANKNYGRTAVFASDKFDDIVNFKNINLGFASNLPAGWTVENISLDDQSVTAAQAQLIAAMNRGTALVTFTGHSSPTTWAFSSLFNTKKAAALTNAGKPFVVVQWGCWNTYHIDPVNNYLVQSFLFSGDQGAAAVLGASTLTDSESEDLLGQLLTPRLVTPGLSIGQALFQAKVELAKSHPDLLDVLLGWSLMGDPALVVEP